MAKDAARIYSRGPYRLAWDRKRDGTLRSPYFAILWYDAVKGRERSRSTRTSDLERAKGVLDGLYLERERGGALCPACGQARTGAHGFLLNDAIADYHVAIGSQRTSSDAIRSRLRHVVHFIMSLPGQAVRVDDVDTEWVEGFRRWAIRQPVITSGGNHRSRTAGTVEASVRQLSAVINAAAKRGDVSRGAQFQARAPRDVSRTPEYRADVSTLAKMFGYATDRARANRCGPLHRFLIASVSTLARPDAVLDLSTLPARKQWNSARGIVALNPAGRAQTKKYRAVVRAPWQFAAWLDADVDAAGNKGGAPFVPVASVKHAWSTMAKALALPRDGEAGTKLIRRSMAQILRSRGVPDRELELQMGHRRLSSSTDLYAPFDPDYLAAVTTTIADIIDEIEHFVPGAFYRTCTGEALNVVPLKGAKNG